MQNNLWTKRLTFVVILLFVGPSVLPSISGDIEIRKNNVLNQVDTTSCVASTLTDWWPMNRHDSGNTGYSLSGAPESWIEYWEYQAKNYLIGSPAVVDGKVYLGPNNNGRLLCLNAEDGSLIWQHQLKSVQFALSPAVESEKVFLSYVDENYEGKIICLNAKTGNQIWEKTIQYFISSTVIAEGRVYVASSGIDMPTGILTCYNATTGNQVWRYTPSPADYITCSPAILDGKLYCVRDSFTGMFVSCLNAVTGKKNWDKQITTDTGLQSVSIVATGNTIVVARANDIHDNHGMIYCLDKTTGDTLWYYTTGEWFIQWPEIIPSLAIAYDRVYFIAMLLTHDSMVYCLDLITGEELWAQSLGDLAYSSPVIADEKMYFSTSDGGLYCLDTTDGDFIWGSSLTGGPSSPVIANQTIFIADFSGTIFAYGAPREPVIPTIQGPAEGKINTLYNFTFATTDSQGDAIYYFIDWGDGQSENWIGPYESDKQIVVGHTWSTKGTFSMQAKAKDVYGYESDWGNLTVKMPCSYNKPVPHILEWLFQRFPNAFPLLRQLIEK